MRYPGNRRCHGEGIPITVEIHKHSGFPAKPDTILNTILLIFFSQNLMRDLREYI